MEPCYSALDNRLLGFCVYCGGKPTTRDHVPSRVLLDEPYPSSLPVVDACAKCNASFSEDELYLACIVECVITGTCDPVGMSREKIRRAMKLSPAVAAQIAGSMQASKPDGIVWSVETERVRNVVLKLARGHAAYELSLPQLDAPEHVAFVPLSALSEEQRTAFESRDLHSVSIWPEIGSRAFIRTLASWPDTTEGPWIIVQKGRYRYMVSQGGGLRVKMVLSEYLASEVMWA